MVRAAAIAVGIPVMQTGHKQHIVRLIPYMGHLGALHPRSVSVTA